MSTATTREVPAAGAAAPDRMRWVVLAIVIAADAMDLMDASIVNVAGPPFVTILAVALRRCSG